MKKNKINNIFKYCNFIVYLLLILGWVFIVINLAKNNLNNENFWIDESGQFWMAKGLYHFTQPYSQIGNFIDVIKQNAAHNLDPGGFTLLLHYWTMFSNSAFWLRALPYIFFILTMLTLMLITIGFSGSIGLGLASLYLIPIVRGDLLSYAFELRAYSMENFGISLSVLLFMMFIARPNKYMLLLLNIILAAFCTTRYDFTVFALIISVITFIFKKFDVKSILYYLPLIVSIGLIFFLSYRIQTTGPVSPYYTQPFMLKYLSPNAATEILQNNIFSQRGVWETISVALALFTIFFSRPNKAKKFILFAILVFAINLAFYVLSKVGLYPWDLNVRWNIPLQMLNLISACVVTGYLYSRLKAHKPDLSRYFPILILVLLAVFPRNVIKFVKSLGHYFRESQNAISSNFHALNLDSRKTFYVSQGDWPTWRYLNEYGSLQNNQYPENTIFAQKNQEPLPDIDYIIQSDNDDINFLDVKYSKQFKEITIYPQSKVYINLNKK